MTRKRQPEAATVAVAPARTRASTLRFYDDGFVFDTVSGLFFRMSAPACALLSALDEGAAPETLPDLLQARYGIDRSTAVRDVALFLNDVAALEPLDRLRVQSVSEAA